jgi:GTP-binding protein
MAQQLRNIAIIAHVDHGKTTLLDGMLRRAASSGTNQEVRTRVMDRMDQERERGITIISKHTAIYYKDAKINVVDTPGHADFGGEVERVMLVVDGVLLLVDAVDGPMPQTRFVLEKALQSGLKGRRRRQQDRPPGRPPDWVVNQTFDLFAALGASDEQLDFPVVYAAALEGVRDAGLGKPPGGRTAAAVRHDPGACPGTEEPTASADAGTGDDLDHRRRPVPRTARHRQGLLRHAENQPERDRLPPRRSSYNAKVQQCRLRGAETRPRSTRRSPATSSAVTGLPEITIGETIAAGDKPTAIPAPSVDEPTLQMTFAVNTSPFLR